MINPDHVPYPVEEHKVRVMVGDKFALAYEWISAYAKNLTDQCNEQDDDEEITVSELLSAADSHQDDKWGDYIVRGGVFEGTSVDPTFWEKYAILRGKDIEEVTKQSFFSCSC